MSGGCGTEDAAYEYNNPCATAFLQRVWNFMIPQVLLYEANNYCAMAVLQHD